MAVASHCASVGGLNVCCHAPDGIGLADFARLTIHPPRPGQPALDYLVEQAGPERYVLRCAGQPVAETAFPQNLAVLLQNDLPRHLEPLVPTGLWLHAALVCDAAARGLLLLGNSGQGKSTAALALTLAGWRYLAEDRVLLVPEPPTVRGLTWAIRFKERPAPCLQRLAAPATAPPPLVAWGYTVDEERYFFTAEAYRVLTSVRPPPARTHEGPVALRAVAVLARGAAGAAARTAGALRTERWAARIARQDAPSLAPLQALARHVAPLPAVRLTTEHPAELHPTLARWLATVWG